MAAPVPLRPDFDAAALRTLAKQSCDPNQTRRLLALATIYDGQPRSEAARIGCVTLQSVRDWVLRFNVQGPAGLINGKAPGRRAILSETQRATLQAIVEQGPIAAIHGVVSRGQQALPTIAAVRARVHQCASLMPHTGIPYGDGP